MLNTVGAFKIARAMQMRMDDGSIDPSTTSRPMKPGHFDVVIKKLLRDGQPETMPINYCCVYPPILNYKTHPSGCEPGLATGAGKRRTGKRAGRAEGRGSHKTQKGRDKYLAWLTTTGEPEWIATFDLDLESARHEFTWLSCWAGTGYPPMPRSRARGHGRK